MTHKPEVSHLENIQTDCSDGEFDKTSKYILPIKKKQLNKNQVGQHKKIMGMVHD